MTRTKPKPEKPTVPPFPPVPIKPEASTPGAELTRIVEDLAAVRGRLRRFLQQHSRDHNPDCEVCQQIDDREAFGWQTQLVQLWMIASMLNGLDADFWARCWQE